MKIRISILILVSSLAFIKNGLVICPFASGSDDSTIGIWNETTGELLLKISSDGPIKSLKYLNETTLISSSTNNKIRFWDFNSGNLSYQLNVPGEPNNAVSITLELSNNKTKLACAFDSKKIHFWDAEKLNYSHSIQEKNTVNCIQFINESILVVGTIEEINLWDINSHSKPLKTPLKQKTLNILLIDNRILLSSDTQNIITWNIKNILNWVQIVSKHKFALSMKQLDSEKFIIISPKFSIRKISDLSGFKIVSSTSFLNQYNCLEVFNKTIIIANTKKEIEIYNSSDWSFKVTKPIHTSKINVLEFLNEKNLVEAENSTSDNFTEPDQITDQFTEELTSTNKYPTTNLFKDKVMSISNLFSLLDISSLNITQLIDNLQNKSFSFDLKPTSTIPVSLLTSSKYDIVNCVSNCSNHGLCRINGNKFECLCELDFVGTKCEIDLKPCSYSPCLNFDKCENILNGTELNPTSLQYQNRYDDFVCTCKDRFYGKRCETKINLCANETCSGNGVCKVIENRMYQNETIKCECFGQNSFEGDKCQIKSSKMEVHEATVKTTSYIAIATLISLFVLLTIMDIHKYFIMKPRKKIKRKNKEIEKQTDLIYKP